MSIDKTINDLNQNWEFVMNSQFRPDLFFQGWSDIMFRRWLRIDKYCIEQSVPDEELLLNMYEILNKFKLDYLSDIVLEELINLEK